MASSSKKTVTLQSCDGETFEVEEKAALQSQTIKHMIEDDCANSVIPLPNVTSKILAKVIEYWKEHAESDASGDDSASEAALSRWDEKFIKGCDVQTIFELTQIDFLLRGIAIPASQRRNRDYVPLLLAANYLVTKGLLDLTCQTVADTMKGKSVEEIRELFNIENDFTQEEEAEIRKENQWAFDEP